MTNFVFWKSFQSSSDFSCFLAIQKNKQSISQGCVWLVQPPAWGRVLVGWAEREHFSGEGTTFQELVANLHAEEMAANSF